MQKNHLFWNHVNVGICFRGLNNYALINITKSLTNIKLQKRANSYKMVTVDREFCFSWPFGVLKTLQVVSMRLLQLLLASSPFSALVNSSDCHHLRWTVQIREHRLRPIYRLVVHLRASSLPRFLRSRHPTKKCGELGRHRLPMHYNRRTFAFIVFLVHRDRRQLQDFIVSVASAALYMVGALICLICVFSSIEHRISVLLTYLFAFVSGRLRRRSVCIGAFCRFLQRSRFTPSPITQFSFIEQFPTADS